MILIALLFSGRSRGSDWSFEKSTGTLTISCTGAMSNYTNGGAPWYNNREKIKAIRIESGTTSIGDYAFAGCSNATTVSIPLSVTSIGVGAFRDCSSLTYILIPRNVNYIGNYAFADCKKLSTVNYSPTGQFGSGAGVFQGCPHIPSNLLSSLKNSGSSSGSSSQSAAGENRKKLAGTTCPVQNLHNGTTTPFKLNKTEVNCTGLIMELYMKEESGYLPYGTWFIYAKTEDGYWDYIAQFTFTEEMNGKATTFDLTFYEPSTFDYLAVCPGIMQEHSRSQSMTFYYK